MSENVMDITLRARRAYLWTLVLNTPLWVLFNMLPIILYKELHATSWQVAIMIALKPTVSLISLYWSAPIKSRPDRLTSNIMLARILSVLPFFLFPFSDNVWLFIGAFGLYMMLHRGVMPAWMEILKICGCQNTFITGSWMGRFGDIIVPIFIGYILDEYLDAWRWFFPLMSCLSLVALFAQRHLILPSRVIDVKEEFPPSSPEPLCLQAPPLKPLITPWHSLWQLLKVRPDFMKFQLGFMLAGAGTMITHPVMPQFFVDILQLNYKEMATALTLCKGVGFLLTTPLWGQLLPKVDIFFFSAWPPLFVSLFCFCLFLAPYNVAYLYVGYLFYGIMQAGSETSWHLSGPIFAKESDSSTFSSVNVLTCGLRGCVVVPLGSLLAYTLGSTFVIALGAILCIMATVHFLRSRQTVTAGAYT